MTTKGSDNNWEENCLLRNTFEIFQNIFLENLTTVFKSPYMPKLEKLFWFLTTLIAFFIAHIISIMRRGFLMANNHGFIRNLFI